MLLPFPAPFFAGLLQLPFTLAPFPSTVNKAGRVSPSKWRSDQDTVVLCSKSSKASHSIHSKNQGLPTVHQVLSTLVPLLLWRMCCQGQLQQSCSFSSDTPGLSFRALVCSLLLFKIFTRPSQSPSLHSGFYSNVTFQLEPSLTPYKTM